MRNGGGLRGGCRSLGGRGGGAPPLGRGRRGGGGSGILAFLFFAGSKEADALQVALAHHVQAEEVGGTGFCTRAGDDSDDFAGLDVAALFEEVLSALDQRLCGVDLGTANGRCAPQQVEAIDGDLDRAERKDGRRGVVFGELAGRVARLGEERDAAQVKVVCGVGRGFANGFGDGEMGQPLPWFGSCLMWRSASATMRAIMATVSTGYLPTADSPESMTASVPS